MGIADRMKLKSAAILAETKSAQAAPAESKVDAGSVGDGGSGAPKVPKVAQTAPGGMAVFREHLLKHEQTVKALEDELAQYRGGLLTLKLDPSVIVPSKYANRHTASFESNSFEELKEEILSAGGNVQPILVRPKISTPGVYEIVFGHRRHRACLLLGIPVVAMVMDVSDLELFSMMDRENRNREDLSPYEQGEMWRDALDQGLFASARQMAVSLGVSNAHISQCLSVAKLPKAVLGAFSNPTEIQVRWAKELSDKLMSDPEPVMLKADEVKKFGHALPAAKVFGMLVGRDVARKKPETQMLKQAGKVVGKFVVGEEGEVSMSIRAGVLDKAALERLREMMRQLVEK